MAAAANATLPTSNMETRKHSFVSDPSTCEGCETTSDSMPSSDDNTHVDNNLHPTAQAFFESERTSMWNAESGEPMNWNCSNTMEAQNFTYDGEDDHCYPYLDRNDMPSTREPSPEPLWRNPYRDNGLNEEYFAEQIHVQGQYVPRKPYKAPAMQRSGMPAQAQPMFFVVPKPVFVPSQAANMVLPMNPAGRMLPCPMRPMAQTGTPPVLKEPSPAKPQPAPVSSTPTDPAPEQKERKEQTAGSKRRGTARVRGEPKGGSVFNKMSAEQKEALCKYIYEVMLERKFTSPDGYLIVDVLTEVWKDVGESAEGWRVAQHRFADLLRTAPQYFRLFRRSIRVANQCGWFARKGEKMVRLVLEEEKEKCSK
jgi:hypothetical protein